MLQIANSPLQRVRLNTGAIASPPLASVPNLSENTGMKTVHYTLHREENDFVAQCLDYDVSSFGATEQETLANLKEAIELYLEDADETTPRITEVSVGEFAVA